MSHPGRALAKHRRVKPGSKVSLAEIDPRDTTKLEAEDEARARLAKDAVAINALQDQLYAEGERALLVILQGTDTSGKDGTIRHVFSATDPLGMSVTAFKRPTEDELARDFLWRAHMAVPRRGTIGIYNRSHYEDVLVGKVRGLASEAVIEQRYDQINAFERMLVENGTVVLKFMLHISKKEQGERLQERLDDPEKRWKFNPGDLEDRTLWDEFQSAYETMLERCSTEHAPWYVIPADRKWARNAAIAGIVRWTLEEMDPRYPSVDWDPKAYTIT
ncbi:MAG TPA: polyphosphate kinase 2 family protein [Beijerinckiaceae bacterium]|jgi:PPK2 family polyphosphate:nucleotide phosphotransferase